MLHPLEHVCDHQNPLADTPALASCQPPQLGRPRFAAKEVSRHRPSPKHGTLAYQLYHIWGSLEPGITCKTCSGSYGVTVILTTTGATGVTIGNVQISPGSMVTLPAPNSGRFSGLFFLQD